jgi:Tfp pilus assembly PilM family ATPase
MWQLFSTRSQPPLGCDFGVRTIRTVQQVAGAAPDQGPSVVTGAWEAPAGDPVPDGPVLRDALRHLAGRGAGRGCGVVLSIPEHLIMLRTLRLAVMPEPELQAATHWKLAGDLGLPAEQFQSQIVTASPITDNGKKKLELVVASARLTDLHAYVDIAVGAGLEPLAIDVAPCALARVLPHLAGPGPDPGLLVLLQTSHCLLALGTGGQLQHAVVINGGLQRLWHAVGQRLEMAAEAAAAIVREIAAAPADPAPAEASGAQAAVRGAASLFARELAREVSLGLQYFEQTLGAPVPDEGIFIAAHPIPREITGTLAAQSGVRLGAPADLDVMTPVPLDGATWACAVGLGRYPDPAQLLAEAA